MNSNAIIAGTFADLKTVKTRSVVQMIVEVPIERAEEVVMMFGFPQPGSEVTVAVARLIAKENSPAPSQGITGGDPSEPSSDEVPAAGSRKGIFVGQSEQAPKRRRLEDMTASNAAALAIKMPQFQRFMSVSDESEADARLKNLLVIGSKSDLNDESTGAARDWRELLESFRTWQIHQRYADMIR